MTLPKVTQLISSVMQNSRSGPPTLACCTDVGVWGLLVNTPASRQALKVLQGTRFIR